MRVLSSTVIAAFLLVACANVSLPRDGSSGTGGDGGAGSAEDGSQGDAGIEGAACGQVGQTNLVVCRETSECPGLVVDSDLHPNCGFRVRGATVDLVCICDDSLCTMGTYASCGQAQALLESQTELSVCTQVGEGRCSAIAAEPGGGAKSNCDRACLAECGGGEACASVCGC